MKVLGDEQIKGVDELLYKFLEKNDLGSYADIPTVLTHMELSVTRGDGLVLADDIENPTAFVWVMHIDRPLLLTEMKEAICFAGWVKHENQAKGLIDAVQMKAKIRGVKHLFLNDYYPFSLVTEGGEFNRFETAFHKAL